MSLISHCSTDEQLESMFTTAQKNKNTKPYYFTHNAIHIDLTNSGPQHFFFAHKQTRQI